MSIHVTNIFIHETAMQENLSAPGSSVDPAVPDMLKKCLKGIHGTLDAFINIQPDDLLKLPVIFSRNITCP